MSRLCGYRGHCENFFHSLKSYPLRGIMKRFPASLPRKMCWSEDVGGSTQCPKCGRNLEKAQHTYVLAVRENGEIHPFIIGTDKGHFCEVCPIVVLDENEFADLAMLGLGRESPGDFTVLGIVDLDAVPKEKRSAAFDDDDNPIPLVHFTNHRDKTPATKAKTKRRAKRKSGRRRRKRQR